VIKESHVTSAHEGLPLPKLRLEGPKGSGQQTAARAAKLLVARDPAYQVPSAKERQNLLVVFAERNMVVYGKAFDIVHLQRPVNLSDIDELRAAFDAVTICEIKSTTKKLPVDFAGYFFSLSGAEMLVAQSLKKRFRFVFVNVTTEAVLELSVNGLFARARGIYPTWSISF
jgi:hypothetical protein